MPAYRVLKVFAALGAAAFILTSVAVAADDSSHPGISDSLDARTARNVLTHSSSDSFFIRSRSVGAAQDDAFEVQLYNGHFTIAYAPAANGPDTVSYSVEFRSISEVRVDGSGEITERVGEPVDLRPNYTVTEVSATAPDGRPITGFRATTNGGLFTVTVWSAERFFKMGDTLVSPTEVKVNLEIRGWVVQEEGTSLALQTDLSPSNHTGSSMEVDDKSGDEGRGWASNESEMRIHAQDDLAFFSWARYADVNSTTSLRVPVRTTRVEEFADAYEMSFLYDLGQAVRGNAITVVAHDPKMGVDSAAFWSIWNTPLPLQADVAVYGAGILLIAAVVGGTVLVARRRARSR